MSTCKPCSGVGRKSTAGLPRGSTLGSRTAISSAGGTAAGPGGDADAAAVSSRTSRPAPTHSRRPGLRAMTLLLLRRGRGVDRPTRYPLLTVVELHFHAVD